MTSRAGLPALLLILLTTLLAPSQDLPAQAAEPPGEDAYSTFLDSLRTRSDSSLDRSGVEPAWPAADSLADLLTVHAEACPHLQRALVQIRELGVRAGVALNPATHPAALDYVVDDVDLVLVMSVNPGFGGQTFIPSALGKVHDVRRRLGDRAADVAVDGGVKVEHVRPLVEHGASIIVAGSAVFGAADPAAVIAAMRRAAG